MPVHHRQPLRAVLLASATATTRLGRRWHKPITHGSALVAFERSIALAPLIRSRRKYWLPRLDIPVCTKNLIHFDCLRESHNVGRWGSVDTGLVFPALKLPALALDESGVVRGAHRLAPFGNCGEGAFGATGAKKAEGPPRQRLEAAFEPGQEGEVDEQPHHPAQETRAAEAVEADDRVATGNGSHTAEVVVLEGLGLLTREPPSDGLCSVNAGLQRDLRHAGEVVEVHHVTDDIHLGVTAQRAVGFDLDPARAVEFRARRLR